MIKLAFVSASLAFLFGLNGCAINEPLTTGEEEVKPETTEQQVNEKDIALRNETESRMMKGEYLHDGSTILEGVGDIESVPALLVVLEKNPPKSNGVMVCTTAHAFVALKKITGADPGYTHKAWSEWWENYKKESKISSRLENK